MSGKKGKGRQPAPSPGPPAQEVQQARLRPVYNALDQKNYSKVLKLTNIEAKNEPICQWDLTKALRVVALDRSGRKRDALVQLQVVIGSGGCWYELNDHILQMDAGLPGSTSTSALTSASVLDPTVGFSAAASAPNSKSKGKKGKGKGKKAHPPSNPPNDLRSAQVSDLSQIDLVDLLDEPTWKRYMKVMGEAQKNVPEKEIIVDDVVLATLKVSLLSFHLNDTLARLYARAADALGSSPGANKEELCSILQESYFAHLRLMCTFPRTAHVLHTHNKDISNGASTRRIWQADRVCEALETAQLSAMTLAKHTGSRLHFSWVANAALMQREANLDAAKLMKARLSTSETTSDKASAVLHDKISKLEGKAAMLPRLAESLMGRVVSRPEGSEQEHPPSAEDWQLYIRSLTEQDRFEDALEQLEGIECASGSSENQARRIDDQTDVTSHDGSLIQLALREKLELKASLCLGLKRYDDAVEVYEQLIQLHPDNWAYWKGLLKSSLSPNASDEQLANGLIHCQKSVQSYVEHESPALHPLRGPHLFVVELASVPLHGVGLSNGEALMQPSSKFLEMDGSHRQEAILKLGKAIVDYANIFASEASCCFFDLRTYVELFAKTCHMMRQDTAAWDELRRVLNWATEANASNQHERSINETKERRKRLRAYIFSIQLTFGILSEIKKCDAQSKSNCFISLERFLPDLSAIVGEWQNSLDLGSNPKEGGQKEVLPGDELIMLACQLKSPQGETSHLLASTGLLEAALHHSPHNPHLKIAAIDCYRQLSAGKRAVELFDDLGIKQIQFDSCSYLITPTLASTGLYAEAIQLAGSVMRLHRTNSKDIQDYVTKCSETGMLSKCCEMIKWQRERMSTSLQLLSSKSSVMDFAPLTYSGSEDSKGTTGSPDPLGARQGIIGGEKDFDRTEEMIRNSGAFFAAPSVVSVALDETTHNPTLYSDNRDITIHQHFIFANPSYQTHSDIFWHAIEGAHWHGVLLRAVLVLNVSKAPRKGKVVKVSEGDVLRKRCISLTRLVDVVETLVQSTSEHHSNCDGDIDVEGKVFLQRATITLCRLICLVCANIRSENDKADSANDTLTQREKIALELMQSFAIDVIHAKSTLSAVAEPSPSLIGRLSKLLPEIIVPMFAILEMVGKLFAIFGWGKRKRHTKPAAGALADAALEVQGLLSDLQEQMAFAPAQPDATKCSQSCSFFNTEEGKTMLEAASTNVRASAAETQQRLLPFINHMVRSLETYCVPADEK